MSRIGMPQTAQKLSRFVFKGMTILVIDFFIFSTADNFSLVQEEVSSILKGRILVGHALHNDLKVSQLHYISQFNLLNIFD